MSWNIKLIGIRENVKAAVLADSQIPPALKEAIAMTIEAGTGDPNVQLDLDGGRFTGRGLSVDVVEASARAYLSALNRAVGARSSESGVMSPARASEAAS